MKKSVINLSKILLVALLIGILPVFPIYTDATENVLVGTWSGFVSAITSDDAESIVLIGDINYENADERVSLIAVKGKKTIDLNGHNINYVNTASLFGNENGFDPDSADITFLAIGNGATLTVNDSKGGGSITFDGKLYDTDLLAGNYSAVVGRNVFGVYSGGTLVLNGGRYVAGSENSVYIEDAAYKDKPGKYSGYATAAVYGSAVWCDGGTVYINSATLVGHGSARDSFHFDTAYFDGSEFIGSGRKGAIQIGSESKVYINDGVFEGRSGANAVSMCVRSGAVSENYSLEIRAGSFSTHAVDIERGADRGGAWITTDDDRIAALCHTVRDGERGSLGIPVGAILASETTVWLGDVTVTAHDFLNESSDKVLTVRPVEHIHDSVIDGDKIYTGMYVGGNDTLSMLVGANYYTDDVTGGFLGSDTLPSHYIEYTWYFGGFTITNQKGGLLDLGADIEYIDADGNRQTFNIGDNAGRYTIACTATEHYKGISAYSIDHTAKALTIVVSEECVHDFYYYETTSNCTESGQKKGICIKCGKSTSVVIDDPCGHSVSSVLGGTSEGHYYFCEDCGVQLSETEEHVLKIVSEREATCSQDKSFIWLCVDCGYIYTEYQRNTQKSHSGIQVYDAYQHWSECQHCGTVLNQPSAHSFNENGVCTVCNAENTANVKIVFSGFACEHGYLRVDVDKTVELNEELKAALEGSRYSSVRVSWKSSAYDSGYESSTVASMYKYAGGSVECTVSVGDVSVSTVIDVSNEKILVEGTPATCISTGTADSHICKVCKRVESLAGGIDTLLSFTDHIYDSLCDIDCNLCGVRREPPHSYSDEYVSDDEHHHLECVLCNEGKTEDEAHEYIFIVEKAVSCTEDGLSYFKCSECDHIYNRTVIPMLNHEWDLDSPIQSRMPSCTENGMAQYKCKHCDATKSAIIEAVGHEIRFVKSKQADCANEGLNEHYLCIRCDSCFLDEDATSLCYPIVSKDPNSHEDDSVITIIDENGHSIRCGDCHAEIISEGAHKFDSSGRCTDCGYLKASNKAAIADVNMAEAVVGEKQSYTATVGTSVGKVIVNGWMQKDGSTYLAPGTDFSEGKSYYVYLMISPAEGIEFADNTLFKLNDVTMEKLVDLDGGYVLCRGEVVPIVREVTTTDIVTDTDTSEPSDSTETSEPLDTSKAETTDEITSPYDSSEEISESLTEDPQDRPRRFEFKGALALATAIIAAGLIISVLVLTVKRTPKKRN